MSHRLGPILSILVLACAPAGPDVIAEWTCEEILVEGRDPDDVFDAMVVEQQEAGVSDEAMVTALWDECGVELGIPPPQ